MLHRAAYRLSGGRFGLSQPAAGGRFGMMRLVTTGRRSGKERVAIVGYFEDGPNLVTLAMNGWGKTEPAWWLNLQANPDANVGLADQSRAVRARAASGAERDRLWARFDEFPGWGDDISALAARRPTETAVVVFEARPEGGSRQAARRGVSAHVSETPAERLPTAALSIRTDGLDGDLLNLALPFSEHGPKTWPEPERRHWLAQFAIDAWDRDLPRFRSVRDGVR